MFANIFKPARSTLFLLEILGTNGNIFYQQICIHAVSVY